MPYQDRHVQDNFVASGDTGPADRKLLAILVVFAMAAAGIATLLAFI